MKNPLKAISNWVLDINTRYDAIFEPIIYFKKLRPEAILPTKAYEGDAGIDFYTSEPIKIIEGQMTVIATGLATVIPEGYALVVRDRSGLGNKGIHHVAGVIDEGYRGEIFISLFNLHPIIYMPTRTVHLKAGDKVAQALLVPVPKVRIIEITGELPTSERGVRGFGSSG